MRHAGFLLFWILFLVHSSKAFFLYADEGVSGLTGRWGPRASVAVFRENPALIGGKSRMGALYSRKYGFRELDLKTVAWSGGAERLRWGILLRQYQKRPLQENEGLLSLSFPLAEGLRGGVGLKCLYGVLMEEALYAFSWDLGIVWSADSLGFHVSFLNGEHPVLKEEVAHTVIAGGALHRPPLHLFAKGASVHEGNSYGVISLFYDLTPLLSLGYGLNTGNGEHRCVLDLARGAFSLKLAYVVPRILPRYISTEVGITW